MSNALVRLCRVTPRDELAAVHNREQLTHLVEESQRLGLISETDSKLLTRSLTEPETPVADLRIPAAEITSVVGAADLDTILRTAADHDRTRMLVREGDRVLGSLHARDALVARAQGRTGTARTLARPVPELTEDTKVADAIDLLRRNRASLAVVRDEAGALTGLVTLDDLLARYLQPQSG
jgi:CBS domain containing-hemolysin-like protein